MGYTLVDFSKSLKADRCKIRNTPNIIFLCGGETAKKGRYRSARDYFYRHLLREKASIAQRVRLAEDVNSWFRQDVFPDLLELENYIADLADTTVLFVESPGSIAELGAFAASDALRPKTLAVLNNFYGPSPSFITDGPVRKIKNENDKLVHYYTWNPKKLGSAATKEEFREMTEDLTAFWVHRAEAQSELQNFNGNKHGHVLLLAADLIRIQGVATITEISDCLKALGCEFNNEQLRRYISLLESMALIAREYRSNQSFYVSKSSTPFIRYAYLPDAPLKDAVRIQSALRESLEPMPKRILRGFLGDSGDKGSSKDV